MARFIFGEPELHHLRAAHSQGKTVKGVADEMGINQATLSKAIQRSEHLQKVVRLYPRLGQSYKRDDDRVGEMRAVSFDEINMRVDTSLLHVRAATMDWRA